LFFAILILFLGLRHPPPLNDLTPIGTGRYLVGGLVAAILVTGFVVVPLSAAAGAVSLSAGSAAPIGSLPPGAMVGTDFALTVNNQDPIPHGFLFSATVTNVSISTPNGTTGLSGAALASWEANATWTFYLPDGKVVPLPGGQVALPQSDYVTVNATGSPSGHTKSVSVWLTDSEAAVGVGIALATNMLCAPSGGGSASTALSTGFA